MESVRKVYSPVSGDIRHSVGEERRGGEGQLLLYTVPKEIDFQRYDTKCSKENDIHVLRGIFRAVSFSSTLNVLL